MDEKKWLVERFEDNRAHLRSVAYRMAGSLVNGAPGIIVAPHGRLLVVLSFNIKHGRIVEIDVVTEHERLGQLDLAAFNG